MGGVNLKNTASELRAALEKIANVRPVDHHDALEVAQDIAREALIGRPVAVESGRDIDWDGAKRFAEDIIKQCTDAAYAPPEMLDVHVLRVHRVCEAIDGIAESLRLRRGP